MLALEGTGTTAASHKLGGRRAVKVHSTAVDLQAKMQAACAKAITDACTLGHRDEPGCTGSTLRVFWKGLLNPFLTLVEGSHFGKVIKRLEEKPLTVPHF